MLQIDSDKCHSRLQIICTVLFRIATSVTQDAESIMLFFPNLNHEKITFFTKTFKIGSDKCHSRCQIICIVLFQIDSDKCHSRCRMNCVVFQIDSDKCHSRYQIIAIILFQIDSGKCRSRCRFHYVIFPN